MQIEHVQRVLIYKRTHDADPDGRGRFGIYDCMGRVRDRDFDAVIGVGGIGAKARLSGLDRKINWTGIGPRKSIEPCKCDYLATIVRFDEFRKFAIEEMPDFANAAPSLSELIYGGRIRHVVIDSCWPEELREAKRILRRALRYPTDKSKSGVKRQARCSPKRRSR